MSELVFDPSRARRFQPRDSFEKTAILVQPVGDEPVTIGTTFGEQHFHGPFFVVAEGDGSYGAAREEFERTHRRVGPTSWRRTESVLAYRTDKPQTVVTIVGGRRESAVDAEAGDWIVQHPSGEVTTMPPAAFDARYAAG